MDIDSFGLAEGESLCYDQGEAGGGYRARAEGESSSYDRGEAGGDGLILSRLWFG